MEEGKKEKRKNCPVHIYTFNKKWETLIELRL